MREALNTDLPELRLLGATEMAQFACDGFIQLEGVVPHHVNDRVLLEMERFSNARQPSDSAALGRPRLVSDTFRENADRFHYWDDSPTIRGVFRIPEVAGTIRSLMGANPVYNHSFVHIVPPKHDKAQDWHADSVIDPRHPAFDLLVMYFPQDTPDEMGPTLVLPGSHLREIRFGSIAHYRNILGQRRLACGAGSVAFAHADLWHCAQPNSTEVPRYMFKVRIESEPGGHQRGWFDIRGYDDPQLLERILRWDQPWFGAEHREEHIQRALFWRYLTGDDSVDAANGQLGHLGLRLDR